ncbi:ImmA/IrrE family metallo-endopeptidase [Methylomicrobium sp. RS1]|uniref:ImmA/IrrE family metallo-endopeptidase n=1 Tax=Candidatus Methylomicrobium oryzae TaxID=2802053 RepID=UPI0019245D14|nr:ImmA/IrrE family metallo-endopeptidase [Methylomicrobium sp. RS1]MBL1262079.1 ImmA/IrrE family metallo-endopeptidase [Methylomicrobium sp. RS1]
MSEQYREPEPCYLPRSEINKFSKAVIKHFNYNPGDDLLPIVQALGGCIIYDDLWELKESDSGSVVIENPTEFRIILANHTSRLRDRFTICHELGHYFLHYLLSKERTPMRAARYGQSRAETEANWFAASFLMPEEEFRDYYNTVNGDLLLLSENFQVSQQAAAVMARHLGLP